MYNFYDLVLAEKENLINDLMEILKYDTVLNQDYNPLDQYPFGKNLYDVLEFVEKIAKRDGLTFENIYNHACEIAIGEGEEILGVLGHLDVVPATGKWDSDPFSPEIRDNKIYARGVLDDKGACIMCYYALKILNKLGLKFKRQVKLILGVDEETGSRCIRKYLEVKPQPTIAFSPDADFPLIYGEKGIFSFKVSGKEESEIVYIKAGTRSNLVPDEVEFKLENNYDELFNKYLTENNLKGEVLENNVYKLYGKSSHAMAPFEGINSIYLCFKFLEYVGINSKLVEYVNKYFVDDVYGKKINSDSYCPDMKVLTLNFAIIKLENNEFSFICNVRYPKVGDSDNLINNLKTISDSYSYVVTKLGDSVPHIVDKNSELVTKLLDSYKKYETCDTDPQPFTIGGGTYARMFKNAVAFGPQFKNRIDCVHKENEHMDIDDIIKACVIYLEGIYNLCV